MSESQRLVELVAAGEVLVLSGAGISTDSGIPDYRGPGSESRRSQPVTYQEFARSSAVRQRYWARSFVGWPFMRSREPNAGHRALAALERSGLTSGLITQNVDGLHQLAGSRSVIELHGTLGLVRCLTCGAYEARDALQRRLEVINPDFAGRVIGVLPDGDADIPDAAVAAFESAACLACGGVIKPDVVFFGENVPAGRVTRSFELLAKAKALLVVGSSLSVRSGYRFVVAAAAAGKTVAIVNSGPTRGDAEATLRLEAPLGEALPALAEAVTVTGTSSGT